jgi:hypothetical protein
MITSLCFLSSGAGVNGKLGQPVRLEYSHMPLPPDDPCWIGFDIIDRTDHCYRCTPAVWRALYIG